MRVSDEVLEQRRKAWKPREPKVKQVRGAILLSHTPFSGKARLTCENPVNAQGTLYKYIKLVTNASEGAITDGP